MAGRSLRPRRESVDYTGGHATNSTPKWLKTTKGPSQEEGRPKEVKEKENDSPPSVHKDPTEKIGSRKASVDGQDEKGSQKGEAKKGRQATKKRQSDSLEELNEGKGDGNIIGKVYGHPLKEVALAKRVKKGKDASRADAAKESSSEADKSDPEKPPDRRTTRRLPRLSQRQQPGAAEKTPPKKATQSRKRQAQEAPAAEDASPQKKQRVEGKAGKNLQGKIFVKGKEETADEVALDPSPPRTRSYTNTKAAEEVRKPIRQPAGKSRKPSDREKAADERTAADDAPDAGWERAAEEGDETAAAPADAATAPLGAEASAECALLQPVKDFYELQAQYKALHGKYSELKMHKIMDIESTITDIRDQEQSRSRKALQLATHWEAEAQRQAAIAQFGDTATLEKELDKLKEAVIMKEQALLEFDSKMMEKEEEVVELKRRMGELVRLVEHFEETRPDAQEEKQPQEGEAPAAVDKQEAVAACPTAGPDSAKRALPSPALVHSTLRSAKAMQQSGARAAPSPPRQATPELESSKAFLASILNLDHDTPAESSGAKPTESTCANPAKEAGVKHIKEAGEWCPEGASLSEPYVVPTGVVAAGNAHNLQSADRPLVPYQMGQSAQQQQPQSRFAKEASAARADKEVPAALERMAHSVNGTAEKVHRDTHLVERQLAFTPLAALENTGGQLQHSAGGRRPGSVAQSSLAKIQTATDEALLFFAELKLEEQTGSGGFKFTHAPTGFTFEIAPDGNEEGDDFEGGLTFKPLVLGSAEELLPPFLKEELRFAPEMRLRLVSILFKFLGGAQ